MRTCVLSLLMAVCALPIGAAGQSQTAKPGGASLAFRAAGTNGFTFDTGVLRGRLRAGGASKGLTEIVYVPTGATVDSSMGLFGYYRIFSANKRYGTGARDWPSQALLRPDRSVAVVWPSASDRPFELRAVYRWAAPNALDLETTVEARTNLGHFEVFLASYFAPGFTSSRVYVNGWPGRGGAAGFMPAEQSAGVWQAFPRDDAAVAIIRDGRWTYPPSPVDWAIRPRLAEPIGLRRDSVARLTAIVMAPPADCFAILTPHQTEPHRSLYLSLFGRDLKPGDKATAHARLLIAEMPSDAQILEACHDYLRGLAVRGTDTPWRQPH